MDNFGKQMVDQGKQAVAAATIEPLKGLGQVVTGVAEKTAETLVTGQPPAVQEHGGGGGNSLAQQVAAEDAQRLAKARRDLANFNKLIEQTHQRTQAVEEQQKEVAVQEEAQQELREQSEREQAQAAALAMAKRGGGTEAMREAK